MACKDFADTSSASLAYGKQADCGTPQTALKELRFTSSDLQFSAESTQSEEIRSDRNVADLVRTATTVSGSVGFELSYEDFDPFIQAALGSAVALDGASTPIENGVAKSYFTFEDAVTAGSTTYYRQFTDCEIDTMSLNIEQGSILGGEMGILGRVATSSDSTGTGSIDTDGYDPAGTNPVYNAVSMVGAIEIDDVAVGEVQSVSIEINNNKREQRGVGSVGPAGVGDGQFVVTGSMTIYFADNTQYDKFLADTPFKFYVLLDDETGIVNGNQIEITMNKVKFGNVTRSIAGNNQDVLLEAEYQAVYDSVTASTIQIATLDAADV